MRATTIVVLVSVLLLSAVAALHLTGSAPWQAAVRQEGPAGPAPGAQGAASGAGGTPAEQAGKAGEATPKGDGYEPVGLPLENPWHDTRGIGRRTRPPAGVIVFPDGTWHPPINGIQDPPPFPGFGRDYPYAPIVRVKVDDRGLSWFEHADGSTSTVQLLLRTDATGRSWKEPSWVVGNPADLKPVRGADGKIRYEKRMPETPVIRTGDGAKRDDG
ncbi:MAG: hypothetical protein R3F30_05205 [Planctomycetota bacterium]